MVQIKRAMVAPRALDAQNKIELPVPEDIELCGGIQFGSTLVKSLLFSTDIAVIHNCNADAVLCVYPFMCEAGINTALIKGAGKPVMTGVAGGITMGERSVAMAQASAADGALAVVANMMTTVETIEALSGNVDVPVVLTVSVLDDATRSRIAAGANVLNVAAGHGTAREVARFRSEFPDMPIMATSGPSRESLMRTIEAGADAISWTPPNIQETERQVMLGHRIRAKA